MFSLEFADYLITNKVQRKYIRLSRAIIRLVNKDGVLPFTVPAMAQKLDCTQEQVLKTLQALEKQPPVPLVKSVGGKLVCDYPEKDVEYVKHLRNALSNFQLFADPGSI